MSYALLLGRDNAKPLLSRGFLVVHPPSFLRGPEPGLALLQLLLVVRGRQHHGHPKTLGTPQLAR